MPKCLKMNFDFGHLINFLSPCLALKANLFGECCLAMNYWLLLGLLLLNLLEKTNCFMKIIFKVPLIFLRKKSAVRPVQPVMWAELFLVCPRWLKSTIRRTRSLCAAAVRWRTAFSLIILKSPTSTILETKKNKKY